MRMPNIREVKIATLRRHQNLKDLSKTPGKKRKTILYWKKILKETEIDVMEIKNTTADREEWKKRVNDRIEHLKSYEKQKGHHHRMNLGEERIEERNH